MTETIRIKRGEKAKIFSRGFSSVPIEYEFQARPLGSGQLDGEVEVVDTRLFFRKPPVRFPLRENNVVKAGLWDTFVDIYVTANGDLEVTRPRRNLRLVRWAFWLVALVVLATFAVFLVARDAPNKVSQRTPDGATELHSLGGNSDIWRYRCFIG